MKLCILLCIPTTRRGVKVEPSSVMADLRSQILTGVHCESLTSAL
jgi:hypothetical protein